MKARSRARRRAGGWVSLLGLLLVLCLSGAATIGVLAAAARRSHATPQIPAPSEPAGQEANGPPVPAEERRAAAGSRRREKAGPGASEAEAQTPAGERSHRRAEAKLKRQAAKRSPGEAPAAAGGEGAAAIAVPGAQNASRRHREIERTRRRERREARKREKEAPGEGEAPSTGEGAPAPRPVSRPVAIATSAPATSALTTSVPTSASAGSTLPAVLSVAGARASAGARHARRAATRAARSSPAPAGARSLPAAATAATPVTAAGKQNPRHGPVPAKAHRGGSSPLGRTVTQIIDVVPAAIRFVIVALLALALALAINTRLASRRAERLARQRRELLEDVGLLQAALLPELPASIGSVGTTAAYRPASGPAAGGDFYDLFALEDGSLAAIVGDVSGHGRKALPHTTLVRFTLRAYLDVGMSPRAALQAAAPVLERQLGGSFATVVLAIYDPHARTLVYSCAGHPPPLLAAVGSLPTITACSAPPIGVGWPTGTRQTEISIPGGARVCFYTDGVTEAKLAGGLFGVERLRSALDELSGEHGADELLALVAARSDEHPDDMAACLLDVEGEPEPPVVRVEEVEVGRHELTDGRLKRFLAAGGLTDAELEDVVTQAAGAVLRDGSVVLKLRGGEGRPRVELAHNNVARMRITARSAAGASEVAV